MYCRPLKNLTPEKQKTSPTQGPPNQQPDNQRIYTPAENSISESSPLLEPRRPSVSPSSNSRDKTLGTKPKIPGLSTEDQAKAIKKQKKKEKIKFSKNENEEQNGIGVGEGGEKAKLSACDVLMWNKLHHGSPTIESIQKKGRSNSLGSSPFLKRGSDQLGSPNSPPVDRETKKNKNEETANDTETDL